MSKVIANEFVAGMNLVKDWAREELNKLDWYSTRLASDGTLIPTYVLDYIEKLRNIETCCIPVVDEAGNLNLKETNLPVLIQGSKKEELLLKLQDLCDSKSREAKAYINGTKVTEEQLSRYTDKYKMAKEFKQNGSHMAELQLEAAVQGLTVDALADLIILKGNGYNAALRSFNAKVEAFRIKVAKLIDTNIESVPAILKTAKEFGVNTTDADIKQLLGV